MAIRWIVESVAIAVHEEQLAEHGGPVGVRDAGLLASALDRPRNLAGYGQPDLAALAAAYGYCAIRQCGQCRTCLAARHRRREAGTSQAIATTGLLMGSVRSAGSTSYPKIPR